MRKITLEEWNYALGAATEAFSELLKNGAIDLHSDKPYGTFLYEFFKKCDVVFLEVADEELEKTNSAKMKLELDQDKAQLLYLLTTNRLMEETRAAYDTLKGCTAEEYKALYELRNELYNMILSNKDDCGVIK